MDVIEEMEKPPAAAARPNPVVERKLGELDACLADAMLSRLRRSDVDGTLFAEIQARTDFLKTLIGAEVECHGGDVPEHLAEAKARLAVLKGAFDQWVRRGNVTAPAEEEEAAGSATGSECSCTESCFGVDVTGGQEATPDDAERAAVDVTLGAPTSNAERGHGYKPVPAPATRIATRRRGWRRGAACCGAAGVFAVVALAVGVAIEFASVTHQNIYVVPT